MATQPECAWKVSSAVNWISGLSPASGQGNGDVEFRVTPNDGSSAREGDIVVNESRVRVSQRAPCRYDVGPQNQSVNAGADAGGVTVRRRANAGGRQPPMSAGSTCLPPLSGNGNGSVSFTVSSNGGAERTGSIIIAGQTSVVTQASAGNPAILVSLLPTTQTPMPRREPGMGCRSVDAALECRSGSSAVPPSSSRGSRPVPRPTACASDWLTLLLTRGSDARSSYSCASRLRLLRGSARSDARSSAPAPPTPAPRRHLPAVLDFARRPEGGGARGNAYGQSLNN